MNIATAHLHQQLLHTTREIAATAGGRDSASRSLARSRLDREAARLAEALVAVLDAKAAGTAAAAATPAQTGQELPEGGSLPVDDPGRTAGMMPSDIQGVCSEPM